MQKHLYRNFSSPDHTGLFNDASLIDKTDKSDPQKMVRVLQEYLKNHGILWLKH